MANSILGLLSSDKFAAEGDRFHSHRRKILHIYPQGGAPLTGLLSLIDTEPLTDSIYYWYEKRFQFLGSKTRGTNPITKTAPSDGDNDGGTVADTSVQSTTTDHYLKVDSTEHFRAGQVISIGPTGKNILAVIIADPVRGVSSSLLKGYLKIHFVRALSSYTAADYTAGTTVRVVGSAYGEGAEGAAVKELGFQRPYRIENTTQIFRTPMKFTGSVLQMGLTYDRTGPYKEKARDTIIEHMTSLEHAILFGRRSSVNRAALNSGGEAAEVRTMSGIIEFLELWDAGSTGLTIDGATYAPYSFKGASTQDSDDEKRIIANADGLVNPERFNLWTERVGRFSSSKTSDKLVLTGSKALMAVNEMFRRNTTFQVTVGERVYGLDLTTVVTPFGKLHFMTHPMFNADPNGMGKWMLFLDPNLIKLRPLSNRDTKLLKNRQNPGDDFRKDEYLTEMGLEFWKPEAHMLIKNVNAYGED